MDQITVETVVNAEPKVVWESYTNPSDITQWNFADPSWQCPEASNDLQVGGRYFARMEAKDGSFGFDFEATYTDVKPGQLLAYQFGDRNASVQFEDLGPQTKVTIRFDPENENSLELQRQGWQAILDNFKTYVEAK